MKFASTHLYTWVEKGTVRVKCLAQEHNTGVEPRPLDSETSALTMRRQMRQMRAASKQKQNNNNNNKEKCESYLTGSSWAPGKSFYKVNLIV